jgi:membrane protease YdiL (CAAX protease family)
MRSRRSSGGGPVTAIATVALVFGLVHFRWDAPDPVPWLIFTSAGAWRTGC